VVLDSAVRAASARRLRGIVIDLRRNPGGSTDLVEALLSRISPRPCPLVSHIVEKRTERNHRWWWPHGAIGDTVTMDESEVVSPRPLDERFPGDAVLLIGPFTYSAAIVMATAAQDCGAATLIGEATGGFANQTAQIHFANLPHSQLRWFAPSRVVRRPRPADLDGPVTPDVFVAAADGADGDAVLAAAIGHLRRAR
jgi:C-terminal processing protease CtpA/Prc